MTYKDIFLYHFCGGKWLNSKILNPTYSNRNWYGIVSCLINTCGSQLYSSAGLLLYHLCGQSGMQKINLKWFIQPVGCQLYSVSWLMSEIWLCASCILQAGFYLCHFCGKDTFCNKKWFAQNKLF